MNISGFIIGILLYTIGIVLLASTTLIIGTNHKYEFIDGVLYKIPKTNRITEEQSKMLQDNGILIFVFYDENIGYEVLSDPLVLGVSQIDKNRAELLISVIVEGGNTDNGEGNKK